MQTEILRDWSRVSDLAPQWNAVLRGSRADSIFLTWEWIQAWLETVGRQYEPYVIAVRDARGQLCGIAPFYVARYRLARVVPYRLLRIAGDWPTGAEYGDWIARREDEADIARAIARALERHRGGWDCLWMPNVAGWTGAPQRTADACRALNFFSNTRPIQFSGFPFPGCIEDLEKRLTHRRQLRTQRTRILGKPGVSITHCTSATQLSAYLEALFHLHHLRRRTLGDEGTFRRRPDEARFYRRFAPLALRAGWLSLAALRENGAFRAVQYGYVYNGIYQGLQEGFDPAYAPGTGNVLRYEVIKTCIEAGVQGYDFLGGFTEHKRRWSAQVRPGFDLFIGKPGLCNKLLFAGNVWPTGRYLKPADRALELCPAPRPATETG